MEEMIKETLDKLAKHKKLAMGCFIWVFIHFVILMLAGNADDGGKKYIWPLVWDEDCLNFFTLLWVWDFSEFLMYGISPIVFLSAWAVFKKKQPTV